MSINLNWLTKNLKEDSIFFDIGCADLSDTVRIKESFKKASFYAFECAESWKTQNVINAKEHSINYFHMAVSCDDNPKMFYPSDSVNNIVWPLSGSIFPPAQPLLTEEWKWKSSYIVDCISLNTFCETHNIKPDFIHIDAQGAEYDIFKNLKHEYRPAIIWAEISAFQLYHTGVSYKDFYEMMNSLGYNEIYKDTDDGLYVMNNNECTPYTKD